MADESTWMPRYSPEIVLPCPVLVPPIVAPPGPEDLDADGVVHGAGRGDCAAYDCGRRIVVRRDADLEVLDRETRNRNAGDRGIHGDADAASGRGRRIDDTRAIVGRYRQVILGDRVLLVVAGAGLYIDRVACAAAPRAAPMLV